MSGRNPITKENEELLHNLYYDNKMMWGRDRLYKIARSKGSNVSRRQVMKWLKEQEIYQLFKRPNKRKDIKSTVLKKPLQQIGIDLVDTQRMAYDGYKYILTAIDLYSKKAWAEALKSKTNKAVLDGMKKILLKLKDKPSIIRSDNGSEFINDMFKKYLKSQDIKQVFSLPGKPQSNGQIERFNGVLKRLLRMTIKSSGNKKWSSYLNELVNNYNLTEHETTGETPDNLHDVIKQNKDIRNRIKKKVGADKDKQRFKVGDKVRVQLLKRSQDGTYWTKNIFTIKSASHPKNNLTAVQYRLEGDDSIYYNHDLQLVQKVENEKTEPDTWEISKLIRPSIQDDKPGYIVRWKGFKPSDDTFEPRDNLIEDVPKLVNQFEKNNNVSWLSNGRFTWDNVKGGSKKKKGIMNELYYILHLL